MSSLKDEVPTETSEDFGFKFLGQKQILPSFNEKLPFASLQNLDISNSKSLFVAASGSKAVVGELQLLRDHITSDSTPLTFKWEKEIPDVIFVCFHGDQVLVSTRNALYSLDLEELSEFRTVTSFEKPVFQLKNVNNTLVILNSVNDLSALDLRTKSTKQLAQNVTSFDVTNSQLAVLLKDRSFQSFAWRNGEMEKQFEFSLPSELEELPVEEYSPLSVTILSPQDFLAVFGNVISETDDEVSYDQKMYIIKHIDGSASFQETFDITPPFGQIVRFPYMYKVTLSGLIEPDANVNVLASSCSSEVSIWDSKQVIEPSQDSERAVLPISEETDKDTNPIGVAVDVVTSGTILEPCSGVDTIERLPLVYILNNEGSLQIVGLFHVAAIKSGHYSINLECLEHEKSLSPTSEKIPVAGQEQEEKKKNNESSKALSENPFTSANTSGFTFLKTQPAAANSLQSQSSSTFGAPSFGSSAFKIDLPSVSSTSTGVASSEQDATDPASAKPVFGKPAFGAIAKEPSTSESAFGKPSFGAPSFGSGKSSVESPASGSAFGKPSFGTPSFGSGNSSVEPPASGSAFGKPSFGTPSFGSGNSSVEPPASGSAFGKPSFGTPSFGSGNSSVEPPASGSAFGKPSFGTSAFGTASSNETNSGSIFGKAAFGSSSFAPANNELFGSNFTISKPTVDSPKEVDSTSPFPSSGDQSEDESKSDVDSSSTPFGTKPNTSTKPKTNAFDFGSSSFGSGFSKALESVGSDTTFKFGTQASPFSSQLGNKSPFSSFTKDDTENGSLSKGSTSEINDDNEEHESNGPNVSGNDLTDSTVEQTSSTRLPETPSDEDGEVVEEEAQKSPIGKLTETIKKSANIDMAGLKNPVFGNHVKAKSESPFSAFATNITKPSSTTPAFSFGNSTMNKSNTSTVSPMEEADTKETSEKGPITLKSVENPFLPAKEERTGESSKKDHNDDPKDGYVSGSEISVRTSESAFDTTANEEIPKSQDVNYHEKSETDPKYSQHAVVDHDNKSKEMNETSKNNERSGQPNHGVQGDGIALKKDNEKENFDSNMAIKQFEDHQSSEEDASEKDSRQSSEVKESDDNMSLNSDRDESISESYDKLEDINTDELPHGGEAFKAREVSASADFDVQTSLEDNYAESGIQTDLSESSKENEVQTDAIPVKHNSTQTVKKEAVDNGLQTEPVETCNFSVQTFEGDENYLAEQCKPKQLKEYYTSAKVSNIPFVSQNSTLRLIESTFQTVEAEFTVLMENIRNMDTFFTDQSSIPLVKRTVRSINNLYTWRIPEAEILLNIQNNIKCEQMQITNANIQDLKEKVTDYVRKDIAQITEDVANAKEEYLFLMHFDDASSGYVKDLSTHQFRMQKTLRQKLFDVSAKINHTEELLNILKLFTVKNKRLDDNPLVAKLAKESLARDGLLKEIKLLREQVSRLQLEEKGKKASSFDASSSITKDMKGFKVVEVGLAMNTKKQIGDFFKNLNMAK
ncbi:Nup159p [Saccharomyces cerevisiae YJM683]|nr:Nup159p [Saccharomyces cerevisiae YJM450]AJR40609.1 Nup159p [Saccharomyces cerevisiae YJM683]AJR43662.1 Nup159p [Saccharomyces cerevisiae YJM1199]AJR46146.1 Nup159p [Saccharomyces cerevisiae YJM1326]AJR48422.1 Nup159p [Saccharomyces cerevisiae YJM1387]AJR49897.1 Nup159p [Saccharomyces cerevisiae YJM1417]KOH50022.1 NUP159p FG-nucleoporin component of central core of the nuclear pore complex [Saccharomyces boulardii (nom. inval.)]CAI4389151.1 AHG_G0026370.mRNA.1.CDS.1 [Saccharomyces cerevis